MLMKINAEKLNVKEWMAITEKGRRAELHGKLWGKVNSMVAVPRRRRASVNINKINKLSKDGEHVIVPGKVLGVGRMGHKIKITAMEYSRSAGEELKRSGCSVLSLNDTYIALSKGKTAIRIIK